MTLRLILARHGKSGWDDPTLDDFDRTLTPRGQRAARAVGRWLASEGYLPGSVVVSGARRTVDTWGQMAPVLPETATMHSDPALYLASSDTMLKVLKSERDPAVLLIGHNPGIADFAARIGSPAPDHPRFADYPTLATTIVDFDADAWADISWGSGQITDFVVPRDLED